ncbi:hypothetical protein BHM03_00051178 [Ensete ventricosum]|nr:hypothetical protein BHM03_00051178 [Ensete ventricosum]
MEDEEVAAVLRGVMEEFSASATVVPFDSARPLLRGPVPAGPADDPASGPFVLAFRDSAAWRSAYRATESMIIDQCEVPPPASLPHSLSFYHFCFFHQSKHRELRSICESVGSPSAQNIKPSVLS